MTRRLITALIGAGLVMVALPVASASAGRLVVTGHDADFHCSGGAQCHFVEVATNYVRAGAPDPSKPVLVLDRDAQDSDPLDFPTALDNAFGAGVVPRVVMAPQSAQFAAEPLTPDRYSAILIASDWSCGGCDLNPGDAVNPAESDTADSDAINARKSDIEAFFNGGGGIYANAGADHGNGDPSDGADVFYNFVPIPVGGVQVRPPFCLTPDGTALGFEDPPAGGEESGGCPDPSKRTGTHNDINCCATHNSFAEPEAGTALKVAERDTGEDNIVSSDDNPETLFAEGVIIGGRIVPPPPPQPAPAPNPPARRRARDSRAPRVTVAGVSRSCVRTAFAARFRIRESNLRSVSVYLDGKRVARTARKSFKVRINARRLKAGRHRIRALAVDQAGNRRSVSRVFARCARAAPAPHFTG